MNKKKVLIAYKFMPQYRVAFFNQLKSELEKYNVDLTVVYGKSYSLSRHDEIDLDWAFYRKNKIFSIFRFVIYWQPIIDLIKGKDLVIVEQASSLLINYYLILLRSFKKIKFSFWGHGRNRQGAETSILNIFKLFFLKKCDYWFAYTTSVEGYLVANGFDKKKISVINNSFDTVQLKANYFSIDQIEIEMLKKELEIKKNDFVAIYCGALYKEKRLDFLLLAAELIKQKIPNFHLLILGSGPDEEILKAKSYKQCWIHFIGARFGSEKAKYFKISNVFLMPGALGLAALDSFAMETPMIIPALSTHGPEIDYLVHNKNCIITKNTADDFASQTVSLLNDQKKIDELISGCINSSKEFTLDNMVNNFVFGILNCLNNERH